MFIQGALALLIAQPSAENAFAVLERASQLMTDFVSDRDFLDMLRVMQVAILQGHIAPERLGTLRSQLAEEFPAGDPLMNRELIRLLVYLQESSIMDRYFEYLHSDVSHPDKVHVAMYLRFLAAGWTTERKEQYFQLLTEAKTWEGGSGYPLYLGNVARDVAKQLTPEESVQILQRGAEWPDAALGALYKLPAELDDELREALIKLDLQIDTRIDAASRQLMVGIVAVLARSGDAASMAYLRTIWDRNPERREPVAMGLAQAPAGENWSVPGPQPACPRKQDGPRSPATPGDRGTGGGRSRTDPADHPVRIATERERCDGCHHSAGTVDRRDLRNRNRQLGTEDRRLAGVVCQIIPGTPRSRLAGRCRRRASGSTTSSSSTSRARKDMPAIPPKDRSHFRRRPATSAIATAIAAKPWDPT